MSLPNDQYGRTITIISTSDTDIYTVTNSDSSFFTVGFPAGTSQFQVYASINAQAPGNFVPAPVLLSQIMTCQQFGEYIIGQARQSEVARSLTAAQRLTAANTLEPYIGMLQSGDLQGFVSVANTIPIDGVIITNSLVAQFTAIISAYLAGSI